MYALLARRGRCVAAAIAFLAVESAGAQPPAPLPLATNFAQLRRLTDSGHAVECEVHIQGKVCAVSVEKRVIALQDDSGAAVIEMDYQAPSLVPGQTISLQASRCAVIRRGLDLALGPVPVVENDGWHAMEEKTGTVQLDAGKNPIRLDWFNHKNPYGLSVELEGPGTPRQPVASGSLFRKDATSPGLDYRAFEGDWFMLPDLSRLPPVKEGATTNFDLHASTREEYVGLQFSGWLDVPRAGLYTFYVRSDDGSRLYVGTGAGGLIPVSAGQPPEPRPMPANTTLSDDEEFQWTSAEGTVSYVGDHEDSVELELHTTAGGPLCVDMADEAGLPRVLLLGSRVHVNGVCRSAFGADGRKAFGLLSVVSGHDVRILEVSPGAWASVPAESVMSLLTKPEKTVVRVVGRFRRAEDARAMWFEDASGSVRVDLGNRPQPRPESEMELLGTCEREGTNAILHCVVWRKKAVSNAQIEPRPVLATVREVQSLKREDAAKGQPVRFRGVVTSASPFFMYSGMVIQDSTRGIFVNYNNKNNSPDFVMPQVGEFWEVEGITQQGDFAPSVAATKLTRLGVGVPPNPILPTWDQLMNGSLDAQYVELEGIVTEVDAESSVTLLTRAGRVAVMLQEADHKLFAGYENTLVRVRGCLLAVWDPDSHQLKVGEVKMHNVSICRSPLVPDDESGAVPQKTISELLQFDLRASVLQRIRVKGQVISQREREGFLMDGGNGMRFIAKTQMHLKPGDSVEVTGYPEMGGPSPLLRESAVHVLGNEPLPMPKVLSAEDMLDRSNDSTLVRVEGTLVNLHYAKGDLVLEMQAGLRPFQAHLESGRNVAAVLRHGSRLALAGVYVGSGGSGPAGQGIDSFEVLMHAPSDIVVLAQPPWWTLKMLFTALGVMTLILLGAMLWVRTLRQRVEAQTKIIHEKVQREATLEERTRIARELHDTLEQALAGISLQLKGLTAMWMSAPAEARRIIDMARSMVRHGQDEARRTVCNLRQLAFEDLDLPTAFSQMAGQMSDGSQRSVEVRIVGTPAALPTKLESHLLRIGQEATTNALKHAGALHIRLELRYDQNSVQLAVSDDGCGFDARSAAPSDAGHFGLLGMRERAEKIGGRLKITSDAGTGTVVEVLVPLPGTDSTPVKT
jgi:signal transduction histidine kinase